MDSLCRLDGREEAGWLAGTQHIDLHVEWSKQEDPTAGALPCRARETRGSCLSPWQKEVLRTAEPLGRPASGMLPGRGGAAAAAPELARLPRLLSRT